MLKGRGRDSRGVISSTPGHPTMRSPGLVSPAPGYPTVRSPGLVSPTPGQPAIRLTGLTTRPGQQHRTLPAKPEPDYEVVEFPSDQYVNAKLQPPPPPPPRPPTGHPAQAGASCGLCGGGGARVRCAECGRRALCASCDDMYHRHPKRRHHQRQALSISQLGEDRPPLPPKGTPPVPPPRRNKLSASPMPPTTPMLDRRATMGHTHATMPGMRASASPTIQHNQVQQPIRVQTKIVNNPNQLGSMPFLPTTLPLQQPVLMQQNANTLGHLNAWNRPRGSLQGFNVPQVQEPWESAEPIAHTEMAQPQWGRPMRRGASTLELGGANVVGACAGCAHCAPPTWRYGSCAALDQPWGVPQGWPMQQCCPQPAPHGHFHHQHMPQTPQPYRRADSRAISRAASRAGSRAPSPALSVRSRASRRTKHRTPSPPLPSSDADSESESDTEPAPKPRNEHTNSRPERPNSRSERQSSRAEPRPEPEEGSLGPVPPPPAAPWQCEHCTYVNEAGVRVCVICCRTPTAAPKVITEVASNFEKLKITSRPASPAPERVEPRKVEQERSNFKSKKERTSTGCGPSPPREENITKTTPRLVTPTREQNGSKTERQTRHDMAVGPSPPKETRAVHNSTAVGTSPPRETRSIQNSTKSPSMERREPSIRASPYTNTQQKVERHSISVGPSPPRENTKPESNVTGQKKFDGTSPLRDVRSESRSSIAGRTNVSNTGTSPPPQSISTQTYEDPSTYERAPSVARSRPRRRFRDDRRERSHSRHSLSSDTRESDRSVRTTGAWEWRERDSSPSAGGGGEWGGRLARRASHLDLRRRDVRPRRTSLYGSEVTRDSSPSAGGGGEWGGRLARRASHLDPRRRDVRPRRTSLYGSEVTRDSSPSAGGGGEWGGRLARRASHLDLRRHDVRPRRTSLYGSEVTRDSSPSAGGGGEWGGRLARRASHLDPRRRDVRPRRTSLYGSEVTRDSSPSAGGGGEWGGRLARRASHLDLRRRDVRPRRTSLYGSEVTRDSSPSAGGGGEWGGRLARRASHLDLRRRDVRPRRTSLYGSEVTRDSSPSAGGGGEWGGRLARRASHLDPRRRDVRPRRTSLYGSEAPSPEPPSGGRALSMEVLTGGRNAERGLELARLLAEAERLGYSAAEVQVGLAQSPGAPLAWLRSRWAGLAGAVRGAAARLAPGAPLAEAEARAALARHRGSVWPAVTECVDMLRRQSGAGSVSSEGRVRGRVWGSPAGAEAEAAAPRAREDSSDEYDAPPTARRYDEDWYPPLDDAGYELDREIDLWGAPPPEPAPLAPLPRDSAEVALQLRSLLLQAGIPSLDENLLLKGLLANAQAYLPPEDALDAKPSFDFIQSENDFIDAYNALTRASPLPSISKPKNVEIETISTEAKAQEPIKKDDETQQPNGEDTNHITNSVSHYHHKQKHHTSKPNTQKTNNIESNKIVTRERNMPPVENGEAVHQNQISFTNANQVIPEATPVSQIQANDKKENNTVSDPLNIQAEEKSSNLNEIVDNTQRLIQQMKEEINSDIHSLDDGHSQTSQSDRDTSSHDEQESSYSESGDETDHSSMTSDEKEVTSSSSENEHNDEISHEIARVSQNGEEFINRTSSEDNEQFEEALDNLDNQIEDVKHANIEILDSIARSLQEEHTISIEVSNPNQHSLKVDDSFDTPLETNELKHNPIKNTESQKISKIGNAPRETNFKREDSNNNIFVEVNSFEEIYAELNTPNVNKTPTKQQNAEVYAELNTSNVNKAPTKQQNAEVYAEMNTSNVNKAPTKQQNAPNITQKKPEVAESIQIKPKIRLTKYAMNESVFKVISPTRVIILDIKEPTYKAAVENTDIRIDNSTVESATEVIHENIASDTNQFVNVDTQEIIDTEPINNFNNTSSSETVSYNSPETAELESNNNVDVTIIISNQEKKNSPPPNETSATESQHTNGNENIPSSQNGMIKRNTPEKITSNTTNVINNNKSSPVKSSIPKPVRAQPNNKAKTDKSAPKLLVSKVPVRRGSLKQHHAPAPPKTHFGNVQSGHVKQLQSKIFNSKDTKPIKPQVTEIEVKPSTSTATTSKKSPAPQPPRNLDQKQQSSETTSPQEKRNNYFRETCRTEDEWTESDSDESQIARRTSVEEVTPAVPSPPQPITLRRVSGNIIDLARMQLPEGSPERQARMLLAEGATETWEQAHLAVELVSRGTELPSALLAALECTDLSAALAYLNQDCELCASRLPEHDMVSMLRCTHRCCRECARLYFTVQITERSIADCVCPFCKMPELETLPEDAWLEYFAHLDIQLKMLLETDVHELFQRKLRDRTLAMDPNFKWCMECSSGFFVHPKQKKLRCPECRSVTCASCRKSWSTNHEGLSCEQYAVWLADNDPEISVAAVQQHLRENGLECPRCHFKYSLSRGGCMHFTCTQCKYEFCYGCGKPFTMGARCGLSEYCAKLGLHAHHPRNCLFYLRDKEPHELQTLLQMNNVAYETQATEGSNGRCPIPLQRETPTGLVDGICGSEVPPKYAGLCKNHYLEYLTRLVRTRGADPLPMLGVDDLETLVRRAGLRPPPRPYGSLEGLYRRALTEIVKEKIPLD